MSKKPTRVDKVLGAAVKNERLNAGFTLEDLAEALGISFQQIQKYEQGKSRIASSRLVEISRALGAPIADFFKDIT